jgi:hypothetical protein
VLGNYIGTDPTGTQPLGNDRNGVQFLFKNNTVGGDTPAAANIIAFNGADGVTVENSIATGDRILGNSIFSNADLGIDLGDDGFTLNDTGDSDTGPNNLQNFPTITSARTTGTSLTVRGNLNSFRDKTFTIEFFSNPSGKEGKTFLARRSVTTDALTGTAVFSFTFAATVVLGEKITATATRAGNTSEFSKSALVKES